MPSTVKRALIGRPLSNEEADHQRIPKTIGLAVFSSDAISSTAYATGEVLLVLVGAAGTGADVLGHPHNALAWLANHLAAEGRGLHAGQIVMTGSLVKTVWLKAGDVVVMELDGLGKVEAAFT